jgi:hypothetical protein
MSDLRERLQELADAAARQGRTPGARAALRRGRVRRLRLAGGTALLVLVLLAVTVGSDRLGRRPAPLAPPRPPTPAASTATTFNPPDVRIEPDPGKVETPHGSPPGRAGAGMVRDVASVLTACRGGDPDAPKVLVAWGQDRDRTWLIAAKPPRPGENWLCWSNGLFEASGGGGMGSRGTPLMPLPPLHVSGAGDIRSGGKLWGLVTGTVTKQAARVRVLFRQGIPPLELAPIQAGDRFPVNFLAGFYRQPGRDTKQQGWVTRVVAYDAAGRQVAECSVEIAGPGPICAPP